jgi:ribosomal protein S18 acetylase RimI-like enzyme
MPTETRAAPDLFAALGATWPPAETRRLGPWTLRRGEGGGSRVSAATLDGPDGDIGEAVAAMRAWGQAPLFMLRPGDEALDARLAALGYAVHDPVVLLEAPAAALAPAAPDEQVMIGPGPLAAMREIWVAGSIGPARLAIMLRVGEPRAFLFGRLGDRPAGCGFAAVHGGIGMMHALEVAPAARRHGVGAAITRAAAAWVRDAGAAHFALTVNRSNAAARALYAGLGMRPASAYHYRIAPGAA